MLLNIMILDDLPEMLDHYFYLESSLIDTVQIIPLENNGKTYSPKLYDILQSTCSHFESLLKMIYTQLKFPSASRNSIVPYYKSINECGLLSGQTLLFRKYPDGKFFYPFRTDQDLKKSFASKSECRCSDEQIQWLDKMLPEWDPNKMPIWWTKYNDTKHCLPSGYTAGNLQNTCFALAGLYALHELAKRLAYSGGDKTFLRPDKWMPVLPTIPYIKNRPVVKEYTRQSELFKYLHQPADNG